MRSSTIALAVGLLAAPLALLTMPDTTVGAAGFPQLLADAAVPSAAPADLKPVDRVAGDGGLSLDAGPLDSTPFTTTRRRMFSDRGNQIANADRVDDPAVTPSLSK